MTIKMAHHMISMDKISWQLKDRRTHCLASISRFQRVFQSGTVKTCLIGDFARIREYS